MDLIPNYWKHLLRTETCQKSLLKTFCHNNKSTRNVKNFQNLSNKEIYFILQSNSSKYNKPFKFISWPNFLEGKHILCPEIWGKTFTDWFKVGSNPAIHRIGNALNILYPRWKEREESHPHLIFYCKLSKTTLDFIGGLINLSYSFSFPFRSSFKAIIVRASSQFHGGG